MANAAAANRLTTFLPMTLRERERERADAPLDVVVAIWGSPLASGLGLGLSLARIDIHQQLILCASATM